MNKMFLSCLTLLSTPLLQSMQQVNTHDAEVDTKAAHAIQQEYEVLQGTCDIYEVKFAGYDTTANDLETIQHTIFDIEGKSIVVKPENMLVFLTVSSPESDNWWGSTSPHPAFHHEKTGTLTRFPQYLPLSLFAGKKEGESCEFLFKTGRKTFKIVLTCSGKHEERTFEDLLATHIKSPCYRVADREALVAAGVLGTNILGNNRDEDADHHGLEDLPVPDSEENQVPWSKHCAIQ